MRRQFIQRVLIALGVGWFVACATVESPTSADRHVEISPADAALFWNEVQRRVPAWFQSGGIAPPRLPSAETVYAKVRFLEVPHELLETCTFDDDTLEIRIGDDKWDSGCVPHELGHAALWLVHHPCWNNFEHPNEHPSRC
jgi:hypothetical protein